MDKPVRTSNDSKMPMAATVAIGGLAVFGALTLVMWLIGVIAGIAKFVIAVVVILALVSWAAGRRFDR